MKSKYLLPGKIAIILSVCIPAIWLLSTVSGCQAKQEKVTSSEDHGKYYNLFFTLDLEKKNISMDDFQNWFFSNFPHEDPTHGTVVYDQSKWLHKDIFSMEEKNGLFAFLRYRDDSLGFDSYRLTSKSFFNLDEQTKKILFVFKGSFPTAEGMWPAWWLNGSDEDNWTYRNPSASTTDSALVKYSGVGQFFNTPTTVNNTDWPAYGEIDIIENINDDGLVFNVIHTCPQMCDSEWNNDGQIINCANARPGDFNKGCNGKPYEIDTLAGTFACLWSQSRIDYYYWKPGTDVRKKGGPLSEDPVPDSWDKAALKNTVSLMETDVKCEAETHQDWQCTICKDSDQCEFKNLKMIFNVTLCGAWAGEEFDNTPNALENCRTFILGEGKDNIDGRFMKIEYVSARGL
jgi:hypothetical protein